MTDSTVKMIDIAMAQVAAAMEVSDHLGTIIPEIEAMEAENKRLRAALRDLRAKVEGLCEQAGGMCLVPTDPENPICERHSELLFDGACEDQPLALIAVLALIDRELEP